MLLASLVWTSQLLIPSLTLSLSLFLFHQLKKYDPFVPFQFTAPSKPRLGSAARDSSEKIGLPGLAESTVMRFVSTFLSPRSLPRECMCSHYVRLSQKNFSIDAGFYPLGSCTMKYNPRINEAMARLPGLECTLRIFIFSSDSFEQHC